MKKTKFPLLVRLSMESHMAEHRMEELKAYSDSVQRVLMRERQNFVAAADKKMQAMLPHQKEEYGDWLEEDYRRLDEAYPSIFRISLFVMCLAEFEHMMNSIADIFTTDHGLKVNEIKGDGIERAGQFLKKVAKVPFPEKAPEWLVIKALFRVRNFLVHTDGLIPKNHPNSRSVHDLIATKPHLISLERYGRIHLKEPMTAFAIDQFACFLKGLETGIRSSLEDLSDEQP